MSGTGVGLVTPCSAQPHSTPLPSASGLNSVNGGHNVGLQAPISARKQVQEKATKSITEGHTSSSIFYAAVASLSPNHVPSRPRAKPTTCQADHVFNLGGNARWPDG